MNNTETITDVKTIDINAKEWFDKVNGNSYFAANITINYGLPNAQSITLPFQYGYGDHYVDMAKRELDELGIISLEKYSHGGMAPLWKYCDDNGIILRTSKQQNCKKAELKNI